MIGEDRGRESVLVTMDRMDCLSHTHRCIDAMMIALDVLYVCGSSGSLEIDQAMDIIDLSHHEIIYPNVHSKCLERDEFKKEGPMFGFGSMPSSAESISIPQRERSIDWVHVFLFLCLPLPHIHQQMKQQESRSLFLVSSHGRHRRNDLDLKPLLHCFGL